MRALVTGGGGFLGGAIAAKLRARGVAVRSFSRGFYPPLARLGVEQVAGDITNESAVAGAVDGCDVVFHVAAKAGYWGRYADYFQTNVIGTRNIIAACHQHNVRQLVFTSSPSVVFGGHGHAGIDETSPYPSRYLAHYPRTKAIAEQEVMAANGPDLATVALRPHLIWGPGDNHLLPRLVERSRAGRLVRVGTGQNRVDTVYIDNAAEAHLLAADRLSRGAAIAGHAYFIANDEPVLLWDFVNQLLDCAKAPPVRRSIPAPVAYGAGAILECVYGVMGLAGEPRMTRFLARQLSTDHWFDLSAARRELGYRPTVSVAEGLARLRASFQASGK